MSNGAACCVLGICCDALSSEPMEALAKEMEADGFDKKAAEKAALWMLANYDFAPKDTLGPYAKEVARLAREKPGKDHG